MRAMARGSQNEPAARESSYTYDSYSEHEEEVETAHTANRCGNLRRAGNLLARHPPRIYIAAGALLGTFLATGTLLLLLRPLFLKVMMLPPFRIGPLRGGTRITPRSGPVDSRHRIVKQVTLIVLEGIG